MKHRLLAAAAAVLVLTLPAQAQLFGPSDEEVAAQKAHEDSQDARIQQNAQDLQQSQTQLQAQLARNRRPGAKPSGSATQPQPQ